MEQTSKQLVLAGRLRPEVRLGLAISEFVQTLDDGRRQQFRQMQNISSKHVSGLDVLRLAEEINKDGARKHRSWRAYGTKLGSFLTRLQTFASIGDVLIGGSQNLIATGVWSAVRLCLLSATSFLVYFEKLSALLLRIGTSCSLNEDFSRLFPHSKDLQSHLCDYLTLVLKLCRKVVAFTNKNLALQVLSSVGTTFQDEYGKIEVEMVERGRLIQQTANRLAAKSLLDAEARSTNRSHGLSKLISRESDRNRSDAQKYRTLQHLSPGQGQYVTAFQRQRRKGTCKWIFESKSFVDWKSATNSSVLCVSGKLGSGKTVAMANIVAQMSGELRACAYFFCTHKEVQSLRATAILQSLAYHLLDALRSNELMWQNIIERWGSMPTINSPDDIGDLLLYCLPTDCKYAILLDGVEDCPDDEIEDTLRIIYRLMKKRTVLFCYSARSGSKFQIMAQRKFRNEITLGLDDREHSKEIQDFIASEIARRNFSQHLTPKLEDFVVEQLVAGSQGMYLWVSLQIDSIFPSHSNSVVTDERTLDLLNNLPTDLPEAFERALEGIVDKSYQGKIFKLISAADRPLTVDELRVALTVTPGQPEWRVEKLPKDGLQLIRLCGGNLLEIDDEDGRVRFIHHSVDQHIISPATRPSTEPFHFSVEESHNFVGSVCVTYLHLAMFESRIVVSKKISGLDVADKAKSGAERAHPVISRLARHMKPKRSASSSSYDLDLALLAAQAQAFRHNDSLEVRCFHQYALHSWLLHTKSFDKHYPETTSCWDLWRQLIWDQPEDVELPFDCPADDPLGALRWAQSNQHLALFRTVLAPETGIPKPENFLDFLVGQFIGCKSKSIHDPRFRFIVDETLEWLYASIKKYSIAPSVGHINIRFKSRINLITGLVGSVDLASEQEAGNAHQTEKNRQATVKARKLVRKRAAETFQHADDIRIFNPRKSDPFSTSLRAILVLPVVQESLKGDWLFEVLRDLQARGDQEALRIILAFHPLLPKELPEHYIDQSAVEEYIYTIIKKLDTLVPDLRL